MEAKPGPNTLPVVHVELISWPDEAARRNAVAAEGRPRLLLVEPDAGPPRVADTLEDWIRLPATNDDVEARVATLARRTGSLPAAPCIDEDGVLRIGPTVVTLPPVEARLARALLERMGAVVGRDALARAGWPDGAPGRNALDVHMLRLRRRLAPANLAITTVRSRGYLLAPDQASSR